MSWEMVVEESFRLTSPIVDGNKVRGGPCVTGRPTAEPTRGPVKIVTPDGTLYAEVVGIEKWAKRWGTYPGDNVSLLLNGIKEVPRGAIVRSF